MKIQRQSNFELLRILAILTIVMGHFIRQSGLSTSEVGINGVINTFFGSGGRIAVNVFLLIGSWFMVDATYKPARALRLYLQTAFYCIPITLLMIILGTAGEARNIIQGLLPFFGRPVWFTTAYISLILLTPFLNKSFFLPNKDLARLCGLLFVLQCLVSSIPSFSSIDYIADLSWFCTVYITVGWIKKNDYIERFNINKWAAVLCAVSIYTGLCLLARMSAFAWPANYWLDNIRTLPNIACAFGIFLFFLKTDIGRLSWINVVAKSTFAVYIIHQTPAFRKFLWCDICQADRLARLPPLTYGLSILGTAIAILIAVTLIDGVRQHLFAAIESKLEKGRFK